MLVAQITRTIQLVRSRTQAASAQAAATLAERADTVVRKDPSNPHAIRALMEALVEAEDWRAAQALAKRIAANADMNDVNTAAQLHSALALASERSAVETFEERAITLVDLTKPESVSLALQTFVSGRRAMALAERAAGSIELTDLPAVTELVGAALWRYKQAVLIVAARASTEADLTDTRAVAFLLRTFQGAGVSAAIAPLAERTAAQANLADPGSVDFLLRVLRLIGATQAAATLARRAATHQRPQ